MLGGTMRVTIPTGDGGVVHLFVVLRVSVVGGGLW